MDDNPSPKPMKEEKALVEGLDYYFEGGLMVLTSKYLLDRGYCCKNGCRHCPYQQNESDSE
jgi:hypothetical protein